MEDLHTCCGCLHPTVGAAARPRRGAPAPADKNKQQDILLQLAQGEELLRLHIRTISRTSYCWCWPASGAATGHLDADAQRWWQQQSGGKSSIHCDFCAGGQESGHEMNCLISSPQRRFALFQCPRDMLTSHSMLTIQMHMLAELLVNHKPNRSDERKRIERAVGIVMWAGTWMVGGVLAMSRAFGNRLLKQFVVAEPEMQEAGPDDDPEAEDEAALEDLEVEEESAVEDAPDASIFPESAIWRLVGSELQAQSAATILGEVRAGAAAILREVRGAEDAAQSTLGEAQRMLGEVQLILGEAPQRPAAGGRRPASGVRRPGSNQG